MDGTIAKYFIICQGGSPTQVEAIAESVGDMCRKNLGEKPVNVAGLGNDQWVAMDFVDVLVHIFLPEVRAYYDLEHLWADAKLTHIPNLDQFPRIPNLAADSTDASRTALRKMMH